MMAGNADFASGNQHTANDPKVIPALEIVEDNFEMNPIFKEENLSNDDRLTKRRIKNRERQRRYRAKKRYEAEMNKPNLLGVPYALLPPDLHSIVTTQSFEPSKASIPAPPVFMDRIQCTRKWKKDAREAHASKKSEGPSEVEQNLEQETTPTDRRPWKADARSKVESTGPDIVLCLLAEQPPFSE